MRNLEKRRTRKYFVFSLATKYYPEDQEEMIDLTVFATSHESFFDMVTYLINSLPVSCVPILGDDFKKQQRRILDGFCLN